MGKSNSSTCGNAKLVAMGAYPSNEAPMTTYDQAHIAALMREAFDLGIMPKVVLNGGEISWDCSELGRYIMANTDMPSPDPTMMIGDGDDE